MKVLCMPLEILQEPRKIFMDACNLKHKASRYILNFLLKQIAQFIINPVKHVKLLKRMPTTLVVEFSGHLRFVFKINERINSENRLYI